MNKFKLAELEKIIGYKFNKISLLLEAVTHKSYANENPSALNINYERLEFLGDSLLGFAAAGRLFRYKPVLKEGEMSKYKARVVCEESLYLAAKKINLGEYIFLAKGARMCGGCDNASILADVMESITAAIYLDGGIERALEFLDKYLFANFNVENLIQDDSKSRLQELLAIDNKTPEYKMLAATGPDHSKVFEYAVYIGKSLYGKGMGSSKKQAQMRAAKQAIDKIVQEGKKL